MLHNLRYSVTFPTTGKSFQGDIAFTNGLTAITGPNEAGKSLVLEFIRYALFGRAALRGKAEDYKTLDVELVFSARGQTYRVTRNRKSEALYLGDEIIAKGTSTLNSKIPEILGFGLKVFDAACSCNQGQIEALGAMAPTERRRMVDSVIGLTVIEDLQKWANDEANTQRRNWEAVNSILVKPTEPVKPQDYAESTQLDAQFQDLLKLQSEKAQLEAVINNPAAAPGAEPEKPIINETIEELEANQREYLRLRELLSHKKAAFDSIPDPEYSAEDLDAFKAQWDEYEAFKRREQELATLGPKPEISREEAEAGVAQWDAYHAWQFKQDLLAKGYHECPSCNHQWPVADLGDYEYAVETEKPEKGETWYQAQIKANERWENAPEALPEVPHPVVSRGELDFHRNALERAETKRKLAEEIAAIQVPPDLSGRLARLKEYVRELEHYNRVAEAYRKWQAAAAQAQSRLREIGNVDAQITDLNRRLAEARSYEQSLKAYEAALAKYQQDEARALEFKGKADQYKAAAEALKILRSKIKQYLVPSLNAVASRLLSRMTGGERNQVEIDEDFNIMIDGQPLETLSGSGKSVANLAIRIGLGQVLTAKIFPVFMGDEIDAAMDSDRAGYTSECLRALTGVIQQVILVTHKSTEADNYIQIAR